MSEDATPRVLIVDDEPINLKLLVDLLRPSYGLIVARDGHQALERLRNGPLPDLALIDVMMPGMTGLELCRLMRRDPRLADLPVIFVSALGEVRDEAEGFAAGAVDYIAKPISPTIAEARVRTHVALSRATRELAARNLSLEDQIAARTAELVRAQDLTIQALASLVEARDNETGGHVARTRRYVELLAEELGQDPRFGALMTQGAIEAISKAAPLHDIGKVGIPDAILHKPGRLTPAEFEVMKTHTTIGRNALTIAAGDGAIASAVTLSSAEFLRCAIEITGSHHEAWDGSGYPDRLVGEAIPVSARLMSLADVYDALTCERVYKAAMSHEEAKAIIVAESGRKFDPAVVDAFLRLEATFAEISRAHGGASKAGAKVGELTNPPLSTQRFSSAGSFR